MHPDLAPRRYGARVSGISGALTGFPRKLSIKLHAADMATAQGGLNYQEIFLGISSLADPFASLSATLPRHHTQLASIYNNYVVNGCKVVVTIINASATIPVRTVMVGVPDNTAFVTMEEAREYPHANYKLLTCTGQADERKVTYSKYFDTAQTLHISKSQLHNDNTYHGLGMSNNPVTQPFAKICLAPVDTGETTDVDIDISMTFYCQVYDLVRQADD